MNKRTSLGAAVVMALALGVPAAAEATTTSSTPTPVSTATPTAPSSAPVSSAPTAPTYTSTPNKSVSTAPTSSPSTSTSGGTVHSSQTTQTQTTPAPAGSSEAYAVKVDNIAAISHTKAEASGSGTSATADPLELGGSPPASQFGGTTTSPPGSHGDLLDTGPSSQFRLALLPWSTANNQTSTGSSADAYSDIVFLDLGTPSTGASPNDTCGTQTASSVCLRVLQSQSHATWTPGQSTGNSSSDGAILNVGGASGLTIDLLHAQTSSSGTGSSYLLSVNGNQIGSSSQANGACSISIPGLLAINCLTATGGLGNTLASVLGYNAGSGPLSSVLGTGGLILTSSKSGSAGQAPSTASSQGAPSQAPSTAAKTGPAAAAPSAAAAATNHSLAFTGTDAVALMGFALALIIAGSAVVWRSRRRAIIA
jgi:hypothetical protein